MGCNSLLDEEVQSLSFIDIALFFFVNCARQHAQKAAVVKIAAVLTPPEPTLAPVTKFGEPVAVGRGHRCASAIRGAAAAVNPGCLSAASTAADAQSDVSAVYVAKAMRKTKNKLMQIQHLVGRQKTGKTIAEKGEGESL